MPKKFSFSVDNIEMIEENPNSNFAVVALDFFASGENLNNMYVSDETLLKTANTIKNCPIVWKYDELLDDVYTHDKDEVPCGFVPETSEIISRRLDDGRLMLSVVAYVWKRYTGSLLEIFKRDGGKKPVSVEMIVYEMKRLKNGLRELLNFRYEGITVLGNFVTPAIPLANAKVLSFSELEKEYVEDFKREFSDGGIQLDPSFLEEMKLVTFPYKSLGDINPAIRGISPPVSLSQANEIARQADAIGSDDEKNGWAIAISNFKKTHEVKDGKWVKKKTEEMEMNMEKDKILEQEQEQEETQVDAEAQTEEIPENPIQMEAEQAEENEQEIAEMQEDEEEFEDEEGESEETPEEDEPNKKEYSIWGNFDFSIVKALFSGEGFEKFQEEAEKEKEADPEIILGGVMEKLSLAEKRIEELTVKIEELKKFKQEVEESQKAFAVEQTLQEISKEVIIPDEEKERFIEESKNYSLENLEAWKNYCKAVSFDFKVRKTGKEETEKIGLPHGKRPRSKRDDLWG